MILAKGWYPDPTGRHRLRYRDLGGWTQWVADDAGAVHDPGEVRRTGLVDGVFAGISVALGALWCVAFSAFWIVALALQMDQEGSDPPEWQFAIAFAGFFVFAILFFVGLSLASVSAVLWGAQDANGQAPHRIRAIAAQILGVAGAFVGLAGAVVCLWAGLGWFTSWY